MILETVCPAGVGRQVGWYVGSREDVCEGERGVPLPEEVE
jgi:hypothetical protein